MLGCATHAAGAPAGVERAAGLGSAAGFGTATASGLTLFNAGALTPAQVGRNYVTATAYENIGFDSDFWCGDTKCMAIQTTAGAGKHFLVLAVVFT